MGQAVLFAVVSSSALVAGSFLGIHWMPPRPVLAALLAFACGALTAALSFELFEESFAKGGQVLSGAGLAAGALVFVGVDVLLSRGEQGTDGGNGKDNDGGRGGGGAGGLLRGPGGMPVGLLLLAGVVLDGIPENIALGTTLAASSGSVALLGAIFVSNFPEALVGARAMCDNGRSVRFAVTTWTTAAIVLAAAIIAGAQLLDGLGDRPLSVILAFAGGAVLASLATTLFPQAYQDGGPWVALATAAGFLAAFSLGAAGPS